LSYFYADLVQIITTALKVILRIFLFFFIAIFFQLENNAQSVKVSGYVLDATTKRPVSGASVIVAVQNVSYMTDGRGFFSLSCNKNDTMFLFFPGYKTARFSVSDSAFQDKYILTLYFAPLTATTSQAVIVRPKKNLEQLEKERKELGSLPRELQQPEVSLMSPISALYELVSARAQERAKLRKQFLEDERRRIYKELFIYFNEKQMIDLPEEYFEQFIDYMGLPIDFLKESSDYEITKTILDYYKRFGYDRGFIK
jgi:hypothetical protein